MLMIVLRVKIKMMMMMMMMMMTTTTTTTMMMMMMMMMMVVNCLEIKSSSISYDLTPKNRNKENNFNLVD